MAKTLLALIFLAAITFSASMGDDLDVKSLDSVDHQVPWPTPNPTPPPTPPTPNPTLAPTSAPTSNLCRGITAGNNRRRSQSNALPENRRRRNNNDGGAHQCVHTTCTSDLCSTLTSAGACNSKYQIGCSRAGVRKTHVNRRRQNIDYVDYATGAGNCFGNICRAQNCYWKAANGGGSCVGDTAGDANCGCTETITYDNSNEPVTGSGESLYGKSGAIQCYFTDSSLSTFSSYETSHHSDCCNLGSQSPNLWADRNNKYRRLKSSSNDNGYNANGGGGNRGD